jgi:hypothetical protein
MLLINSTRMLAGYSLGMESSGRELLVVVVKGTFGFPEKRGAPLRLHEEQAPLVMSDVFHGEPGQSAPKYEVDFAPGKRHCDVLLNGTAYAPGGKPAERCTVGVRIGQWQKTFSVVGDRHWLSGSSVLSTSPQPFVTMPVGYDRAFGGTDLRHEDVTQHAAFAANPSGRGFHRHLVAEWLHGSPLPNTEETGVPIVSPDGEYRPMAFGPIGRHWQPRVGYAGTYDAHWQENVFPFLPADFDPLYYQAAPADQQTPRSRGEKTLSLLNLTPDGRRDFVLPHLEVPIHIFPKKGQEEAHLAQADTIVIEPDTQRVMVTWRVSRPLRRSLFEVDEVLVGRNGSEWWQQRENVASRIPSDVEPPESEDRETKVGA